MAFRDFRLQQIVQTGHKGQLVDNVRRVGNRFNELAQGLVAGCDPEIVEIVHRYRTDVVWNGHALPPPDAELSDVRASLGYKFHRNVGQAFIEALVCVDSALAFLRDGERTEAGVFRILARSTSMIATIAVLHDHRQVAFLESLLGGRPLVYPATSAERVVRGEFRIDPRDLTLAGAGDAEQVRLARKPPRVHDLESPTMGCPAHRLTSSDRQRLNDRFWALIVEVYARSAGYTPVESAIYARGLAAPVAQQAAEQPSG